MSVVWTAGDPRTKGTLTERNVVAYCLWSWWSWSRTIRRTRREHRRERHSHAG